MNHVPRLSIFGVILALALIALPAYGQTVKRSFTDVAPNAIPALGTATRYPATIAVSGVPNLVYHVSVTLNLTHTFLSDLDILLVSPNGTAVMLMSDTGGANAVANRVFTLDDCAGRSLLSAPPAAFNRYRSTNIGNSDPMPAPAPPAPYGSALSAFNWSGANGTWSLYVVDDTNGDSGSVDSWTLTFFTTPTVVAGGGNPPACATPDYDGDGRADIGVYREATGEWYILQSGQTGAFLDVNWGSPTFSDIQVPADYDGDGITDIAVYRQTTGEWFIRRSSDLVTMQIVFGAGSASGLGDTPVPGDYDGDGLVDIAVYRTSSGQWFVRSSAGQGVLTTAWGFPPLNDQPARR